MKWRSRLLAACTAVAALLLAGCGLDRPGGAGDELSQLKIMVPAAPGGGWDQTSRALQQAMEAERVVGSVEVTNVEGAGGTVGLAQLASSNDDQQLMTMGLVMVGAVETNDSAVTLEQVTPIARLTGEGLVLVVPASSSHRTLADFVTAWRADPGGTPIAGGSGPGCRTRHRGLTATLTGPTRGRQGCPCPQRPRWHPPKVSV